MLQGAHHDILVRPSIPAFPNTAFTSFSEKVGKDIIQETSRQLESTARKNNNEKILTSFESNIGFPTAYHMHSYQPNVITNKNEPIRRSYENNFSSTSVGKPQITPKFQRGPSEIGDWRPTPRRGSMTVHRTQTRTTLAR